MKQLSLIISIGLIVVLFGRSFLMDDNKTGLLLFFLITGCGLALLRIFVNSNIKKMKGKDWKVKVGFFAVLLSIGLPIQNLFRTHVLMKTDADYLLYCILILISSIILMTFIFRSMRLKLSE